MHANQALMTEVLKGQMGFDGFIMGDWNAHGQIPGCSNADCAAAFNAGLDIFNAPADWKALYANLVREVNDGTISLARIDDAVRRVLRVKVRMGVFEEPAPDKRPDTDQPIGTAGHRAIARQAVSESLVLLKNDGVLPIKPNSTVLIAGDGADNIAMQSGGLDAFLAGCRQWPATDFPGATSIYQGLKSQIEAAGGHAQFSPNAESARKADVAIVVFGETPYAEFMGDQRDVALHHDCVESLDLIKKLKAQGIPVVAVMLSGRALYVNPQINEADAFVAAWLPGSEGEGVADVLTGKDDFSGKLSFSWPKRPDQTPLNVGDATYDPQFFAYGFGLRYASPSHTTTLPEVADTTRYGERNVYYTKGTARNAYKLSIGDINTPRVDHVGSRTILNGSAGLMLESPGDGALHAAWNGASTAWLEVGADKLQRHQPRGQRRDDAYPHCAHQHGSHCRSAAGRRFRFGAGDRSTEGAPHRQLCDPGRAAVMLLRTGDSLNPQPSFIWRLPAISIFGLSDIRLTESKK